ncbi:hypothetical protein BpHYR1_053892 [Brachionus plicatilis]|uniref:Uncharacterized protein n=1 Tax=Brachionus plicatilis TaxID=10195 RepID=A0A3M7T1Z9_BRAPC|nr:hypothetical protein BpHYR1_053892 [Brachionus plicatilis]
MVHKTEKNVDDIFNFFRACYRCAESLQNAVGLNILNSACRIILNLNNNYFCNRKRFFLKVKTN